MNGSVVIGGALAIGIIYFLLRRQRALNEKDKAKRFLSVDDLGVTTRSSSSDDIEKQIMVVTENPIYLRGHAASTAITTTTTPTGGKRLSEEVRSESSDSSGDASRTVGVSGSSSSSDSGSHRGSQSGNGSFSGSNNSRSSSTDGENCVPSDQPTCQPSGQSSLVLPGPQLRAELEPIASIFDPDADMSMLGAETEPELDGATQSGIHSDDKSTPLETVSSMTLIPVQGQGHLSDSGVESLFEEEDKCTLLETVTPMTSNPMQGKKKAPGLQQAAGPARRRTMASMKSGKVPSFLAKAKSSTSAPAPFLPIPQTYSGNASTTKAKNKKRPTLFGAYQNNGAPAPQTEATVARTVRVAAKWAAAAIAEEESSEDSDDD